VAKGTGRRKQVVEDSFHDVDPELDCKNSK